MQEGPCHLGMLRRCLHFDDGQHENTSSGSDSSNACGNEGVSRSAVPTAELGHSNPSSLDKTAHTADRQSSDSSFPKSIGESAGKGTKPLGFGLHLNSFITSVQCGASVSMKSIGSGSLSIRGNPSSIIRQHSSESSLSCSLSCNEANLVLANINIDKIERDQAIAVPSESVLYPYCTKLSESEYSNPLEPNPCDMKKYSTASSNINEELSQSSPEKKRLKKLHVDGGDGCKRCNCKKTKCLKLYCDCFAAGIYCAEPCACQGCFNRPEYEDIVIDTRLQIESRNPHAFASKIIQHATEASTKKIMEDKIIFSSAARHKRGCNCKKSMCLKKYCECYQANVGCSDGCRCDGCQNVYGRREEYGKNKHLNKKNLSELCDVGEKQQDVASTNDTVCQQFSPLESTPQTPSFQCSINGKDGSNSLFPSGRFLPSPKSVTIADFYPISPGPSGNINNHGIIQDANKDIIHLGPVHQELDNGNLITADEFSPRQHGLGASSIINLPSLSGPHDYQTTRIEPQPYENRNLSSGSSLRWRRSPISLVTNFEENKYLGSTDFDRGLCEAPEVDTPDILKDNVKPFNSVKVCSPSNKRVSPPHAIVQELGSSSSAGLKICRKFILKSVPSFHPSVDSKDENPEPRQP